MNRGNRKQRIFEDDRDRRVFLRLLVSARETYGVKVLANALMSNHFHLAVTTPHDNLSEFMQQLEGQFARYSNWRHKRVGHLFQGRFRAVRIDNDLHLLTALCYIFMNPVTGGLSRRLEGYRWSTYAATVGLKPLPNHLTLDWLSHLFPAHSQSEAQVRFRQIMCAAHPVSAYLEDLELNVSFNTIEQVIRSYTGEQLRLASFPTLYRTALRPDLDALFAEVCRNREQFVWEARVLYGYRNAEIARVLGLKPATISSLFRQMLRRQGDIDNSNAVSRNDTDCEPR